MEGRRFGASVLANGGSHQDVPVACTASCARREGLTFNARDLFFTLVTAIDSRLNH